MRRGQSKTSWHRAVAIVAMVCLHAGSAAAQVRTWTLEDVLTRAREQAPQIVAARLAIEEARGALVGASSAQQPNPVVDFWIGNRQGTGGRYTDLQLGLSQMLDPGRRRTARVDGATAGIDQEAAGVDETTRAVLRLATAAYYRALHANARIRLLERAQELAEGVYTVADRRFRAGDIAVLDVNLARATLARTRADRAAAEAGRTLVLGDLKQLLRVQEEIAVDGVLTVPDEPDLGALLRSASARPELRVLEAAIRQAEADERLGLAFDKPTYGVGARYSREEGDQIVLGALTIALPVFSKGQELRAVGTARAVRLRAELDAARTRIQLEVRTAVEASLERRAAVRVLEIEALPGLDESDTLTTRSYDVGQISLPELLLIRREFLDTRFHLLDALLEATLARVDVDASAAILR